MSKLRSILAEEGLHVEAAPRKPAPKKPPPVKPAPRRQVPIEERETALLDILKALSVSGAVKDPDPISEKHPGHTELIVRFVRGLFKVEVKLEYNANWDGPSVDLDGFAPTPGGQHESIYAIGQAAKNLTEKPADINKSVKEAFATLEEKYQPLDSNDLVVESKKLKTPSGFSRDEGWGAMPDFLGPVWEAAKKNHYHVVLTGSEGRVRVIVNYEFNYDREIAISGHTNFLTGKGWFTFSRRGIDDSFYGNDVNMNKILGEEIKKAEAKIESYKEAVTMTIGGSNFTLTPDRIESIKASLKKGTAMLLPGGMGTGYRLATKPFPGRYGVGQASAEAAAALGVPRLFYESFDHD